ncbi:MAG: type-4 uracil-DNA glycosylase [Desulfurococcaceae archaeon]
MFHLSIDEWNKLNFEIINCKKCILSMYRKNPVPGEGRRDAIIMFVGEAPGAKEDEEGRPFVGAAGKLLTSLIESIGLSRDDVYITNLVKCRPPNNRDPEPEEIETCSPYLIKQILLIKPKIIVTLGRHSGKFLFEKTGLKWRSISSERGREHRVKIFENETILLATYHPAAALYNPEIKGFLERDFELIRRLYVEISSSKKPKTILDYF